MKIDLYPFQQEDVEKLQPKKSALIINDMGTGKTYEAIARDRQIRQDTYDAHGVERVGQMDTLVIAPLTTIMSTWYEHFDSLTTLPITALNPKDRDGSYMDFLASGDGVLLVHWEALRLMPILKSQSWMHIIADECQRMKNRKIQQTRSLKTLSAEYKTAMSGTPAENRPDELWSVLNWLYPRDFRSYWKFFNQYTLTENVRGRGGQVFRKVVGVQNTEELQARIAPFSVRRRKKDVLKDLPDKYYTEIKVDLNPKQRKAYDTMRDDMIAWIGQQEEALLAAPVVIAQLTRLQQFAVAFAEWGDEGKIRLAEPSSKLDAVMEVLDETPDQVVIFTRFKGLVTLLGRRLQAADIPYVTLTGSTPQEERAGVVERFQRGQARVFVGTIRAGGVGITLHAASRVVFTDRDWNPAANTQAEDRLHRIGQTNAVQVIDITARNTVDLGRNQILVLKKEWIKNLLGDPE